MSKRKAPLEIGYRAYKELCRVCPLNEFGKTETVGCDRKTMYDWKNGGAPDALFLQRLHYMGADVIYILTGRRTERKTEDE